MCEKGISGMERLGRWAQELQELRWRAGGDGRTGLRAKDGYGSRDDDKVEHGRAVCEWENASARMGEKVAD